MAKLSEEQGMLRDAASDWVRESAPLARLRRLREHDTGTGYEPELYEGMVQMGWTGILVPEEYGGSAFGCLGMGLVLEQLGRQLVASPLVATAVASASVLALGGSAQQQRRWLPGIAEGRVLATLALDEGDRHAPQAITTTAIRNADGWRLDGSKRPVCYGLAADLLVVAARISDGDGHDGGIGLFLVEASADGLRRTRLHEIDTRGAAIVAFDGVQVSDAGVLGAPGGAGPLLDRALDRARACTAMEMLGAAQQAFETTLDHLKTRVQFGQLIGAFQALQHRAAGLYGELELTRSAVEAALRALDEDDADSPARVSLAKALAGDTFRLVAAEAIQLHGGIGMTEEHDAGLYFKRARSADLSYGDAAFHRERYGVLRGY
ncbi:acyl-CoA dehydrogenase family protein [Luteimonas saliphila]|uniref:acyl-CoA dehydrogenase family protein n=1 Tax=Luteimonas saliphila TaxID=2804919 RepID=UPI00192DFC74|nr:acyl-CoA dehydrogenase family protein [Luteimonas saliphila]